MKYKVTLNGRTYEVEVVADKAMCVAEYEAIAPAAAPAAAPVAAAPVAAAPVAAPAAEPVCCAAAEEAPAAPVVEGTKTILISRVTCPNCRVAEGLLGKAGFAYEKLIADDNKDLCLKYGVKGAPTLVITDGENHVNYYSVPEIKKYLASV